MRPRRLRTPRTPRTLRLPAPRSSLLTSGNSSLSMNSRRYLAGSQRRRRGRTALVRSWHSALDNQLTEGRAILILCNASEPERHRRERRRRFATTRARCTASDGSRSGSPTTTPNKR